MRARDAPSQESDKVERRIVGPVHILNDEERRASRHVEKLQRFREQPQTWNLDTEDWKQGAQVATEIV